MNVAGYFVSGLLGTLTPPQKNLLKPKNVNTHLNLNLNFKIFPSSGNALCGLDINCSKVSKSKQNLDIVVAEATTAST